MNLFISFDWDDRNQVNGFRGMLANPEIELLNHRDTSVKYDYSGFGNQAIKDAILKKIKQSHVIVCLISQKTKNSKWVNWELEQARASDKSILGFVLRDQPVLIPKGCPEFFIRYKQYKVYEWSSPEQLNKYIQQVL